MSHASGICKALVEPSASKGAAVLCVYDRGADDIGIKNKLSKTRRKNFGCSPDSRNDSRMTKSNVATRSKKSTPADRPRLLAACKNIRTD